MNNETFDLLRSENLGMETREQVMTGTLGELTEDNSYVLEVGKSYEDELGNLKINVSPTSIEELIDNLNNAVQNTKANGITNVLYEEL